MTAGILDDATSNALSAVSPGTPDLLLFAHPDGFAGPVGTPTAVSATATLGTTDSLDVSWTAPADTGWVPLTGYTVTAQPAAGAAIQRAVGAGQTFAVVSGLATGTEYTITVTAHNRVYSSVPSALLPVVTGGVADAKLVSLVPARLAYTRPGYSTVDGQYEGAGNLTGGQVYTVKVTGRGGLPETGVSAVALNVTITAPSKPAHLTVFPTGSAAPDTSNLNFTTGQTIPNMVIARVGPDGTVSFRLDTGTAHLIVDIAGYFPG